MKRSVRSVCLVLACLIFVLPLVSCENVGTEAEGLLREVLAGIFGPSTEEEKEPVFPEVLTGCFLFAEESFSEGAHLVYAEEIEDHEPFFSEYDSQVYYDTLTEAEQLIYRAFQYALDHSYQDILISEELKEAAELRPAEILEFLSLDSAHLEQNLYETGQGKERFLITGERYYGGEESTPMVEGFRIYVFSFSEELEKKRMEALSAAFEVDFDFAKDATEAEKAETIFRWFGENVSYDRESDENFLYSAIVERKTICDGYANAFQLFCGIYGIECCEKKTDFTKIGRGDEGHTWNMAKLDGVWYNVDPTAAVNAVEGAEWHMRYSDAVELDFTAHLDRLPECTESRFYYVGHFETLTEEGMVEKLSAALQEHDTVIASFQKGESEVLDTTSPPEFQEIANRIRASYETIRYTGNRQDLVCFRKY